MEACIAAIAHGENDLELVITHANSLQIVAIARSEIVPCPHRRLSSLPTEVSELLNVPARTSTHLHSNGPSVSVRACMVVKTVAN
eukprot:6177006-Pleurochrysis_carterae.AAC.1